ncbi:MAG: ferritin family protein [Sedimentisphaerales bacterium]|nr:ferritin family protein [Sedimentisphaerales bacterium]
MVMTYTADEIYEIAEQIERDAAEFYREAAETCPNEDIKKILFDMSETENEHLRTFQNMREKLTDEAGLSVFDPFGRSAMYLQAIADARSWEGRINPMQALTGNETAREIIEIAVESEKEMVVFYVGLKDLVYFRAGKDKVEEIIIEELNHICALLKKLKSLG